MRVLIGLVVVTFVLFAGLFAGGIVLGLAGKQSTAIPTFIVAALAGSVAAEAAKRTTPKPSLSRVIAASCLGVLAVGIVTQIHGWRAYGSMTWGSALLIMAILLGLFGSWARWQQEDDAAGRL